MIRKIKKLLFFCLMILLIAGIITIVFKRINTTSVSTLPADIQEIRQAVKLSTLDITSEEIYRDTINGKGIVSKLKARIYIRFDIEHIPMFEQGDTLIVQLPPEVIEIYESSQDGYQVIDVWHLRFPDNWVNIPFSSSEENIIKERIKQKIRKQMYEKGYVQRARKNAVHSLATLFSKFRKKVVIVDLHPDGYTGQLNAHDGISPVIPKQGID